MNLFLAFLTGLTTGGLSCLAIQGGLLASSIAAEVEQTVSAAPVPHRRRSGKPPAAAATQPRAARPIVIFLVAKLIAYTILGFLLGLLGSVLQLTPTVRAVLQAAIGIFMLGTALRMLDVHPIFRYFTLEPPRAVTRYIRRKAKGQATALTPAFLGALTVLIPCGITQAMMAVAMGTGSPFDAAALMFAFVLGTSPVFFTVAYLATRLGRRLEAGFMRAVAVVLLVLGLVSINSGLTLMGSPYAFANVRTARLGNAAPTQTVAQATTAQTPGQDFAGIPTPRIVQPPSGAPADVSGAFGADIAAGGFLTITASNNGYTPSLTHAPANRPLKLALVTKDTYSCAAAFVVPSLGVERILPPTGKAVIDIPPQPAGSRLFYSCSMGMYSGAISFEG
jgi:sulfite exporter TauE/SafE